MQWGLETHYILVTAGDRRSPSSPFAALSVPDLKKGPIYRWVDRLSDSKRYLFTAGLTERVFSSSDGMAKLDPEVIKLFSCTIQLSMKFFLLINVKMPTIVGILIFMSGKNSILGLSEPKKAEFLDIFIFMSI